MVFPICVSRSTALWSADTPTLQRQVGCDFCQLIRHVPEERIESWMDAFWFVMQREWDKLDRYRLGERERKIN